MSELHVERMTAAVADWPDPGQVLGMLRHVAETRLDDALREQPLPDGEWCVRRIDVAVDLDPERPLSALEAGWADRIVTALRQSLRDGSSDIVRFVRPEDAVDDLFAGLVAHRYEHAWAWRQVGLIESGDPLPEEDARALLLAVLHRMRHGAVAALVRLVATTGVGPVHRLLGTAGWEGVASVASREAGASWTPGRGSDADSRTHSSMEPARSAEPDAERGSHPAHDGALGSLAAAVAASGSLVRAFRRSGLRLDEPTLEAWAVLALAESDPLRLRRAAAGVRDLVRALVAHLRPEARPGIPAAAPSVSLTDRAGATVDEPGAAGGPRDETDAAATATTGDGDSRAELESPAPGPRTEWGGLLFLLNTADEAGIPEALGEPPFDARTSGWVLHRLARRLVPVGADDPAILALAGLDRPPTGKPDALEMRALARCAARWRRRTADRLRRTGTDGPSDAELVDRVARRAASITREPGWIEVCLSLDDVDLDIRRAGLDVDPGWLGWLGRVVRFRYE